MAKFIATVNDDAGQVTGATTVNTSNTSYNFGSTATSNYNYVGFRFTNVTIPNSATIHKATLKVSMSAISISAATFLVKAEAADNAAAFATTANNLSGRTYTANSITQRIHDLTPAYVYLDVTQVVQDVINRGGWASGNALHVSMQSPGGSSMCTVETVDSSSDPSISITYADTATSYTTFGSNTGSFASPTNATSDNASYATTTNSASATHTFYNFGFSIPSFAVISDLIVLVNGNASSTSSRTRWGVELSTNGGTSWSTQKMSNQINTSDSDHYFGGDPDGWSIELTPALINDNTNFRVRLQNDFASATNDANLDYIAVKVVYNTAPSTALNSPADTATGISINPTLNFTGTDSDGDSVEYNVQIDTVNTFDSNNLVEDAFSGGALDTGIWTDTSFSGGSVTVTSGYVQLAPVANTTNTSGQITTASSYDLTNKYTKVNLLQVTSQNAATYFYIQKDSSNKLYFRVLSGTIIASKVVGGSDTTIASMTYNSTTHAWLGFFSIDGNIYFAYSSDNVTWTNWVSLADPFVITSMKAILEGYDFSSDATPGSARFDNFKLGTAAINKYSESDTGFTAGHPFGSGVAKDFTVQAGDTLSYLTNYYWRVRAIDPNGSNIYGDWSSTRSFTTTSSSTTTTKTLTGISRIQKAISQTLTGKGAVLATTTKTLTGISRILKSVTQTLTGVTRITASTSRTQTGATRIQKTVTQTLTGVTRITISTLKTLTGISRITASTSQTQSGKGNINTNTSKTQTGASRVTATTSQTNTGKSSIAVSATQTQDGLSRILQAVSKTLTGISRITATTLQTQAGKASILKAATQTLTGVSRIVKSATQTITGKSSILQAVTKTLQGASRVERVEDETQSGLSRITATTTKTQTGKGKVDGANSQDIEGISRVTGSTTQTQTGKAAVLNTTTQTTIGKSRIEVISSQTLDGLSKIQTATNQTIVGLSRVTATTLQTITGKAAILRSTLQTITGKARIQKAVQQTIQAIARLQKAAQQTITGISRITVNTTKTLTGKTRIQRQVQQTLQGASRVQIQTAQTQSGKSTIVLITIESIDGKASIVAGIEQTITGKTKVVLPTVTNIQTTGGIARIRKVGDPWFTNNNTQFSSEQSNTWYTNNNTSYRSENNTDWYSNNNTDWEDN